MGFWDLVYSDIASLSVVAEVRSGEHCFPQSSAPDHRSGGGGVLNASGMSCSCACNSWRIMVDTKLLLPIRCKTRNPKREVASPEFRAGNKEDKETRVRFREKLCLERGVQSAAQGQEWSLACVSLRTPSGTSLPSLGNLLPFFSQNLRRLNQCLSLVPVSPSPSLEFSGWNLIVYSNWVQS